MFFSAKTCGDLVARGVKDSGEFILHPTMLPSQFDPPKVPAYCDMEAEGGVGVSIISKFLFDFFDPPLGPARHVIRYS